MKLTDVLKRPELLLLVTGYSRDADCLCLRRTSWTGRCAYQASGRPARSLLWRQALNGLFASIELALAMPAFNAHHACSLEDVRANVKTCNGRKVGVGGEEDPFLLLQQLLSFTGGLLEAQGVQGKAGEQLCLVQLGCSQETQGSSLCALAQWRRLEAVDAALAEKTELLAFDKVPITQLPSVKASTRRLSREASVCVPKGLTVTVLGEHMQCYQRAVADKKMIEHRLSMVRGAEVALGILNMAFDRPQKKKMSEEELIKTLVLGTRLNWKKVVASEQGARAAIKHLMVLTLSTGWLIVVEPYHFARGPAFGRELQPLEGATLQSRARMEAEATLKSEVARLERILAQAALTIRGAFFPKTLGASRSDPCSSASSEQEAECERESVAIDD